MKWELWVWRCYRRIRLSSWVLVWVLGTSSSYCWALNEINLSMGHQRYIYGTNRQSELKRTSYTGTMALYFFETTGFESFYMRRYDRTTVGTSNYLGGGITLVKTVNRVETTTFGIGLRQALVPRRFRIIPIISAGYARRSTEDETIYYLSTSLGDSELRYPGNKVWQNSSFAAFILKIILGRGLALTGSVRTVVPNFEHEKAKDHLNYDIGLAVMF